MRAGPSWHRSCISKSSMSYVLGAAVVAIAFAVVAMFAVFCTMRRCGVAGDVDDHLVYITS